MYSAENLIDGITYAVKMIHAKKVDMPKSSDGTIMADEVDKSR